MSGCWIQSVETNKSGRESWRIIERQERTMTLRKVSTLVATLVVTTLGVASLLVALLVAALLLVPWR